MYALYTILYMYNTWTLNKCIPSFLFIYCKIWKIIIRLKSLKGWASVFELTNEFPFTKSPSQVIHLTNLPQSGLHNSTHGSQGNVENLRIIICPILNNNILKSFADMLYLFIFQGYFLPIPGAFRLHDMLYLHIYRIYLLWN